MIEPVRRSVLRREWDARSWRIQELVDVLECGHQVAAVRRQQPRHRSCYACAHAAFVQQELALVTAAAAHLESVLEKEGV